jgi:hypothetical protein
VGIRLSVVIDDSKKFAFYADKYASPPEMRKAIGTISELTGELVKPDPQTVEVFEWAKTITQKAGGSRAAVKGVSKWARLGVIGTVIGAGIALINIAAAPLEERPRIAAHEAGSFLGGMLGAEAGGLLGVFVTSFLIGLGVLSAPATAVGIALVLLGSFVGAFVVGHTGGKIGDMIYNWFS